MSLPDFSTQGSLYSIEVLLGDQFAPDDPFRLFASRIQPLLVQARPALASAYCADNGRAGIEPVLLLGVSLLQFMERIPDREAMHQLKYNLGWKMALGRELDLKSFDPTTLVHFRQRLMEHEQAKLAFDAVLEGLREAGLVSKRSKQRLDSTHVLGLVARLSLLELLRETIRLALQELHQHTDLPRPPFWAALWERYVEGQENGTVTIFPLQCPPICEYLVAMPRTARRAPGGVVFHVLNRGVARRKIFRKHPDFAAFERVLEATLEIVPMRVLAYCLMPNHWHLLLWPRADGELRRFMQRLSTCHVRRWQSHYHEIGNGHVYQARFKSFPVQEDGHFLTVARYVERNALRAKLVEKAEDWQWGSLWRREHGSPQERGILHEWPVFRPADWITFVNGPQTDAELAELRLSISKGRPFGSEPWQHQTAKRLGLKCCFRGRGRPKRQPGGEE